MRRLAIIGSLATIFTLVSGCRKEEDDDPCAGNSAPSIILSSWPSGLDANAVDTVYRSGIYVSLLIMSSGANGGVQLRDGSLRLVASGTDSLLYYEVVPGGNAILDHHTMIELDSITSPIPATLHIAMTNRCDVASELHRSMLVMPD